MHVGLTTKAVEREKIWKQTFQVSFTKTRSWIILFTMNCPRLWNRSLGWEEAETAQKSLLTRVLLKEAAHSSPRAGNGSCCRIQRPGIDPGTRDRRVVQGQGSGCTHRRCLLQSSSAMRLQEQMWHSLQSWFMFRKIPKLSYNCDAALVSVAYNWQLQLGLPHVLLGQSSKISLVKQH